MTYPKYDADLKVDQHAEVIYAKVIAKLTGALLQGNYSEPTSIQPFHRVRTIRPYRAIHLLQNVQSGETRGDGPQGQSGPTPKHLNWVGNI